MAGKKDRLSIGHSWVTPDKQFGLSAILALQQSIARNVILRNPWYPQVFYHIDAYAGDGQSREGSPGSPIVFLEAIERRELAYRAFFVDIVPANTRSLLELVCLDPSCSVQTGKCEEVVPVLLDQIPPKATGLLYCDPNVWPDMEMIRTVSRLRPRMDILLRLPATTGKRIRCALGKPSLASELFSVGKRKWLVRGPLDADRQQWTFLFGTNYSDFPSWRKHRFVDAHTDEGQSIMLRLVYTAKEREAMQAALFFQVEAEDIVLSDVMRRSKGRCERCHDRSVTEIHHLSYPPRDLPENLLAVCHPCHCQIEGTNQ